MFPKRNSKFAGQRLFEPSLGVMKNRESGVWGVLKNKQLSTDLSTKAGFSTIIIYFTSHVSRFTFYVLRIYFCLSIFIT